MNTIEEFLEIDNEEYRDSIATVDEKGKRLWVYPKKPRGWFHNKRIIVSILLLILFFATPFIWIGGHPLFLFNIFERKFIVFGTVFMPQDFHLVALGLITFFVFIILFTVLYGRIWCGWTCPQTVFMEMVFRKIEYWIEGDANQQRKLNAKPWDTDKIIKKTSKQLVFILISILIAHTAMAYLIGIDQVLKIVSKSPSENLAGFIGLVFFTFIFYGVFAYLREQACIVVCPYGRLQGVLLSKDSIVVAYDFIRGEPRGKLKRKNIKSTSLTMEDVIKPEGDCIDCKLCVHVCPTGIDIRNGTQLECVNCTACIDVCDEVMEKIDKPKGLIRYASYNNIANKTPFKFTTRIFAYSVVLVLLLSFLGFLLTQRGQIETTILRMRGSLPQEVKGNIVNIYSIQIANKSFEELNISLKLKGIDGTIKIVGDKIEAEKSKTTNGVFLVEIPKANLKSVKTPIEVEVWDKGKLLEKVKTHFLNL